MRMLVYWCYFKLFLQNPNATKYGVFMNVKSVMMLLAVFGLTACASSGPSTSVAPATTNSSQSASTEAKPAADKDVICTSERALNTRFAKKKCRTAAQVEANKAEAREIVRGGSN
jgi:hypothetical protein